MSDTVYSIDELLSGITPADAGAMSAARKRQAELAKPPGSLGRLEDLAVQVSGITGNVRNRIDRTAILVFAADNGVAEEGVSSAPVSVTRSQTINLTLGKTGCATLARHYGSDLIVCDVGVNGNTDNGLVLQKKIAFGTANITNGPAMSADQFLLALNTGFALARKAADDYDAIGIGEMGIANTTTSSAVLAALTGCSVDVVTGRGGGITDESFLRKKDVINRALLVNQASGLDAPAVLSKVGGFDLAAMCGAFLGAAAGHCPVVIDGFISAVAALCAYRICPSVRDYLIPSHASFEIGYRIAMDEMQLKPLFLLGMRLGEGSGCPLAFGILSAACAVQSEMATFAESGIDDGYLDEIRTGDRFTVEKQQ